MIKKSLLITEWNKFEVIEPLHFPKGILLYHVVEFSFLKIQYVWKDKVFYIGEKN